MIVGDLLRLEDLPLGLAWGTEELLDRRVTGVTSTDLQDPARYLQPGELVLSGLVWWSPEAEAVGDAAVGGEGAGDEAAGTGTGSAETAGAERVTGAALRFVTSLSSARVAALLAGEGTHGRVPQSLVDACRVHGVPLISIPAGTSFRAVTDRIYLRLWGELNAGTARAGGLPESARQELAAMLESGTPPARILTRAVTVLGLPRCAVRSASGRLIAASDGGSGEAGAEAGAEREAARGDAVEGAEVGAPVEFAAAVPAAAVDDGAVLDGASSASDSADGSGRPDARVPVGTPGGSPFDAWYLVGPAPSSALADLLAPLLLGARALDSSLRAAASALFELLAAPGTADPAAFTHALGTCSLPVGEPLTTVTARIDHASPGWALDALTELLQLAGARFAAGTDDRGEAAAVVAGGVGDLLPLLSDLQRLLGPGQVLRVGVGPTADSQASALRASLAGARYALASADPYADAARTDSLAALLAGIPAPVTASFHERLLGPLLVNDRENTVSLLDTLAAFLEHNCSWARTAKALHVHVNTVHYRARRIEELTGRSLVLLTDQADLRAALLCTPTRR
ncbi:PucR family transcriptional regulator [Streptacidiphilus cavernicola]|uniref:PucR family transcriptional regulator n=1 Tax=Streptacidiphilus cavernicola TaxID=3342716 RepID=A0ABV6VYR2_9ACTN